MQDMFGMAGPTYGPLAGGRPQQLILLLHGVGADGNDLIGLAPYMAQRLPAAVFVSPHAPFPCDMAPYGRQWFSLLDRSPEMLLAGVMAAAPILDGYIDDQLKLYGVGHESLGVIGFSQGTMMALHVLPRRQEACACVVGYSGAMVGPELLVDEIRCRPPVLLIHGDSDDVVPFHAMAPAARALAAAGIQVATDTRPGLGHSIDEPGLIKGQAFLIEALGKSGRRR